MATLNKIRQRLHSAIAIALFGLMAGPLVQFAAADDNSDESTDQAICIKMIEEMVVEIQKYCKSRNLNTLQYLKFVGAHGTVSNETLEQQLIESLKKHGIKLQEVDSTRLRGRIASQPAGDSSILLVQCTLTDASGAELRTFRLRQVLERS